MNDRLDLGRGPRPIHFSNSPRFRIVNGKLVGPGVIYAPTSFKFYRRPDWCGSKPLVAVLHYTAVLASNRPMRDLEKLLKKASIEYEALPGIHDAVGRIGHIPDCLSLSLQNACKKRKASWCFCIGLDETPDGEYTYVTQYSPDLRHFGTMHAGPGKLWKWKKKYRGRQILTQDGDVRWDGKKALWPMVPDKSGQERLIWTPNPSGVGLEIMNVGPLGFKRIAAHPSWRKLPKVKVGNRTYHKPSQAIMNTTIEVLRALHNEYGIEPQFFGRHQDYTPKKVDPEPPFDVNFLRRCLTQGE